MNANNSAGSDPFCSSTKNTVIGLARVLSMLMIIGCHLASWLNINTLAMILNVGVYIFLIISGALYSTKHIANAWSFIKNRWFKLCVPMYLFVFIILIYNIITSNYEALHSIPIYLLNLQGVGFIVYGISLPQMNGLGHLWFISAIMLCYVLLIAVKEIERYFSEAPCPCIYFVLPCLLFLDFILAYTVNIQLHYFIAYFIGYWVGKKSIFLSGKRYLMITIAMVFALGIRLFSHNAIDGTVSYNDIIVPFTHIMLAVWIYMSIQYVYQNATGFMTTLANSKLINWLESLSLYIYITHYVFLIGPFYIDNLPFPTGIQLVVFFIAALASAVLLKYLSQKTIKALTTGT